VLRIGTLVAIVAVIGLISSALLHHDGMGGATAASRSPGCRQRAVLRPGPQGTVVRRSGQRIARPGANAKLHLAVGDQITDPGREAATLTVGGATYSVVHGQMTLKCGPQSVAANASAQPVRTLFVAVERGTVTAAVQSNRGVVWTPEMLAFATRPGSRFSVTRDPQTNATDARAYGRPIVIARTSNQSMRVILERTYTGISDRAGLRVNVWPFSLSPLQRPVRASDHLPEYWADGQPCATGCGQGYVHGWPLKPFHRQHAIRAGIDEIRPANLHVAVDIQANDNQPVYAIQSGYAEPAATGSPGDYKVTVGRFTYWHIVPAVTTGEYVTAYKTVIGHVERGQGHIAFSEGADDSYLNPLRPGGPLTPYTDTARPVIARPSISPNGRVTVAAFDPQSFVHRQSYLTPVLALAGLAWRLYNAQGRPVTGLEWALRASGYIAPSLKFVIFAPGARNPGYACFATRLICTPDWTYNLAGGLTEPLPLDQLSRGRYRLTVYAWDFKGNESALDDWFTVPLRSQAGL
jgi:hypothetical protein